MNSKREALREEAEDRFQQLTEKNAKKQTAKKERLKTKILETLHAYEKLTMAELHQLLPTYSEGHLYKVVRELKDQGVIIKHLQTYQLGYAYRDGQWVKRSPNTKLDKSVKGLWAHPTALEDPNWIKANFSAIELLTETQNPEVIELVRTWARERPILVTALHYGLLLSNFFQDNQRPLDMLPITTAPVGIERVREILEKIDKDLDDK